jgi:hypothetical protein
MHYNFLIIGSNFARVHLWAIKKVFPKSSISICSPNINKKYFSAKIKKYSSYKLALKNEEFNFIVCATIPKIQDKVIRYIFSNKININFLFLEKPILDINFLIRKKKITKKFFFDCNFIYLQISQWKAFKRIIKDRSFYLINYSWIFKQAYFKNRKKTWKISERQGGGLALYYLPHAIFNLVNLYPNLIYNKIFNLKFKNKILVEINMLLKSNKSPIFLKISNFSNKNLHCVDFYNKDNKIISLTNYTSDWTKGFKIHFNNNLKLVNNKKEINKRFDDRKYLLLYNYRLIRKAILSKDNDYFNKRMELIKKTFNIVYKVQKQIKNKF